MRRRFKNSIAVIFDYKLKKEIYVFGTVNV